MERIGMETAQNVMLDHEVASIGDRLLAYIIDALIIITWIFLWRFIESFMFRIGVESMVFSLIAILPLLCYHLVSEITMNGQSLGKRQRQIKVARFDGGQPRLGQYLLRWVLRPVDSFYGLGLIVILVNGKGQRLGDLAAGTTVVSLKPRLKLKDTLMTEVPKGHIVRFPESIKLSDAQAAMIREVLNNTKVADRWALMDEMAEKVRAVIGNRGEGMRSMEFLHAVLRDHVHLTGQMAHSGFGDQRTTTP
jgi:uncharacterized RDD family membrane protein YckC